MAQNGDTGGSDEPEDSAEGGSPETERNADDQESGVELGSSGPEAGNLEVVTLELADSVHTANEHEDDKEQGKISEQAVDDEHGKDGCVIAREVAQIVVDPALHLAKVGGLGDALDIEELGDGAQVGKSAGKRL